MTIVLSQGSNKNMIEPKKFVNLHGHTSMSVYDAIGTPQDHIDFARSNGSDALAITDHGNANAFSHQYLYSEKLKKQGINFTSLYGAEVYFVPSLTEWKILYEQKQKNKESLKKSKINNKKKYNSNDIPVIDQQVLAKIIADEQEKEFSKIGNEMAEAEEELEEIVKNKEITVGEEEEDLGGTIIEDETESKSNKWSDPLRQRNHLVLLTKNSEGLKALFKIISTSSAEGYYYYPRVDFDMLKKYANGNIIASSACIAGNPAKIIFDQQKHGNFELWEPNDDNKEIIQKNLAEMIAKFQDALGKENFNLELQWNFLSAQHLVNYHLIEASKRTGCPLVVTCDSHYSRPEHWREREIYRLLNPNFRKNSEENAKRIPQKIDELKCELYPKNVSQIWESYKKYSESYKFYDDKIVKNAIERTHDVAHLQIEKEIHPDKRIKLPALNKIVSKSELEYLQEKHKEENLNEDELAFKEIKKISIEGLKTKKLLDKQIYIDRLKYELDVVKYLKNAKYFLTYHQLMKVLGEHMLLGPGRGSSAGSLLAYTLGITQIDPIKYGLLFERFQTKKKQGASDIDSDVADRESAVKILQEHFGEENVIPVSNFSALKPMSLIKDLSKFYDVPFNVVNSYTVSMMDEVMKEMKSEAGFDASQFELTFELLEEHSPSFNRFMAEVANEFEGFRKSLEVLFKQQRSLSRHAGGVCITENSRDSMPLIKGKGGLQTPWPEGLGARHLEGFGLLKFDILGLSTLKVFEHTIRRILKKQGKKYVEFKDIKEWYYNNLHPDNNSMDDLKVFKHVYWDSNFCFTFQFVKPNVQKFMKQMRPKSIMDIAIATSIYRPGPMGLKAPELFLKNREEEDEIEYIHPVMKEILGTSGNLLIFQEQLQLIVHKLSGMPLEDTDSIRKAFTKKDKSQAEKQKKDIETLGDKFVTDCMNYSGISREAGRSVWKDFEKWTSYGFCAAHAVSYAVNSYICAYLLTYYPDEWVASYLDFATDGKGKTATGADPKAVALMEARSLGYKLGKPDINFSEDSFVIKEGKILVPSFSAIKGVGKASLYETKNFRPYKNVDDLLFNSDGKWRHSKFNKRALGNLIRTEAFGSMDLVGPGKIFENYKQMYNVLIENHDLLKKTSNRKKDNDARALLFKLIEEVKINSPEDWTLDEKIDQSIELSGAVDVGLILSQEMLDYFSKAKIESIDSMEEEGNIYWTIIDSCEVKETSTRNKYLNLIFHGDSGARKNCKIWSWNPIKDILFKRGDVVVGKFKKDKWGLKSFPNAMRKLTKQTEKKK